MSLSAEQSTFILRLHVAKLKLMAPMQSSSQKIQVKLKVGEVVHDSFVYVGWGRNCTSGADSGH
jgi:hypothetical protein